MSEEEKKRRRRTREELEAYHQQKLTELAQEERKDAIRLLAGIYDDLRKLTTYKCADEVKDNISKAIEHVGMASSQVGQG